LIAIFLALTVGYFVFALKKFDQAVMALPLFFPAYLLKVQIGGIPFTLVEAFIYAVFLACLLRFVTGAFKRKVGGHSRGDIGVFLSAPFKHKMFWPILLFIAAAAMGVFFTSERITMLDGGTIFYGRKLALGIFKSWIIAPVLMFWLFTAVVKKTQHLLKLLNFYTVSALLLSLWGLFQVLTQSYGTPDARASGPFESANYLALYISPAVLYMAIRVKESVLSVIHLKKYSFWQMPFRRRKMPLEHPENFLFIVAFMVIALVLLFTKSYAAMAAVFVAAVFYFGLEYLEYHKMKEIKKFPWKLVLAGLLFAVAVMTAIILIDQSKLQALFQFQLRNSSSVRVEVYTIAMQLLKEHWFTGIGLGQFPAFYQLESVRILGHAPYEWNMLHPHNLYLALWLNMGLPGIIAFFWLIYVMVRNCWGSFRTFAFSKIRQIPKLRVAGFALILIILVHGCLDTPFFKNDLALLFWLLVSVTMLPDGENTGG